METATNSRPCTPHARSASFFHRWVYPRRIREETSQRDRGKRWWHVDYGSVDKFVHVVVEPCE